MRMWGVEPKGMCRRHLLGEHVEMHMLVGTIRAGKSVRGYTDTGLMDLSQVRTRHDALAREMVRRGYRHGSPLPPFTIPEGTPVGSVDVRANRIALTARCTDCANRSGEKSC